jgi:hypothetical protein
MAIKYLTIGLSKALNFLKINSKNIIINIEDTNLWNIFDISFVTKIQITVVINNNN